MENNKQSSVDLMFNRAKSLLPMGAIDARQSLKETYQQAKEMHRQEIIDSFGVGCQVEASRLIGYHKMAEQYYNEIYGKDNADNTAV